MQNFRMLREEGEKNKKKKKIPKTTFKLGQITHLNENLTRETYL